ncbi:MAG: bifunctional demethylmenaquinone methyltransferase/2-methoxy-6-polyprenyl-1,4-benzoquinol methylase UbiE [SAR324 cluster bacterium]|nr:bifunctional demethylmenaquinone methyltransferase/2-methoxy-6-polyprenyl-1,4-benzoquinol methylase UbiE [SAR324 cluster bacterium]
MSYQLPENSEKSSYVQQKFNEIASKYDLFNDLITFGMHRYWKRFVVRQTGVSPDGMCLDLCCGTGDIAHRLLRAVPQGRVCALDFSQGMLHVAKQRGMATGESPVFLQGDAIRLPIPSERIDAVTIGYGLRNVTDLSACLAEILRVLKPGGVLVSLDVGKVRLPVLAEISRYYFFYVVPRLGKLLYPGQDMFDYLPHSSINYPNQESLKRIMLSAGFKQVDVFDFLFGSSTVHVAYKP